VNIAFPLQIDRVGRTATASDTDHIQQMIEQLLFTRLGERVMQPNLGCSLWQLAFEPNSPEIAAVVQMTVQASLQQWLGDIIRVDSLDVTASGAMLTIALQYVVLATGSAQQATFTQGGAA
jgi:phage baseplate assembly protein W